MQNSLKSSTFITILKHALTQPDSVYAAIFIENTFAEVANDFIEGRLSGLTQTTGDLVSINNRHATRGEKGGDRGFATAYATGQTNA